MIVAAGAGCTDVELKGLAKDAVFERQQVRGRICAPPYLSLDVPYRVLFVIDTSLSNEWNDPTKRRVDAVRNAINDNIGADNVSFGVITFSDVPRVQTFSFTRDLTVLEGATKHIGVAQGGTNFSDTMWIAKSFIMEDLASMPPTQAARTHYLVFWLSDGFPTIGTTTPGSLLPMVKSWAELLGERAADFKLHTAFLGAKKAASKAEEAEAKAARELLQGMAQAGGGSFTDIPEGQAFSFEIDPAPVRALFELQSVVVSNRHALVGEHGPLPDSDADGIADAEEESLGLDPRLRDSDGDGYRDGFEVAAGGALDPRLADDGCGDEPSDSDGDGLRDCEEVVASTQPDRQDTDGDSLPDALEVMMGTSPLDDHPTFDRDHDGLPDQVEVRAHLPPRLPTRTEDLARWSYGYDVRQLPREDDQPACYSLRVDNIVVVPTRRTAHAPAGTNEIDIYAVFSLEGGVEQRWYAAQVRALVLTDPYVIDPVNGRFELEPSDFRPLP